MRTLMLVTLMAVSAACVTPLWGQETQSKKGAKKAATTETPPKESAQKEATQKEATQKWTVMFDGKQLKPWKLPKGYDYEDAGKVEVKQGNLVLNGGLYATGVRWPGKFPKTNYEFQLEAQRVDGYDFFAGVSFPVGDGALTLILGGWGGYLTGLSCIDGYRADENETCSSVDFKNKTWYRVCVRVTDKKVIVHVDDEEICNFETPDRKLTVTSEMEPCLPFGIATWGGTTGALRRIRYRTLTKEEMRPAKK